ncbi:SseB family protein [Cellulomonas sp. NPDC089187]|uniref:SseB family protein n=1 Tax=Cellulomonas sp. NPDC089187 TaxID=3154970 RepID=UPI00343252EF
MTGRELPPTSAFAGDDGTADPALVRVLTAHAAGEADVAAVVTALAGTRVLVPVLAEAEATETVDVAGRAHTVDRQASAGIVALQAPDGRTALPVFSSVQSMAAWRHDARPVPSEIARAALSAVEEGWELLVLDPGGPVTVLVPRPAVWALAQQVDWSPAVSGTGDERAVDPQVHAAVRAAISAVVVVGDEGSAQVPPAAADDAHPRRRWWQRSARGTSDRGLAGERGGPAPAEPAVRSVDVAPGERAEVAVELSLTPGLDRGTVDALLRAVGAALAGSETVTRRVDSVQVRLR